MPRRCVICKAEIEAERAEVLPETRLCLQHAEEIRKYGGEFTVTASQERTSKAGSLKINYGGVTTSKKRNDEAILRLRDDYDRLRS